MPELLTDWPRPFYEGPGGRPFLFYVVYGAFGDVPAMDARKYRSQGVHPGLTLAQYTRLRHAEVLDGFRDGELWDQWRAHQPGLAAPVQAAAECLILQGELDDRPDLNYLRDTVGLLTFLLDHGGVGIFDPLMFRWWGPEAWRREAFEPATPSPGRHVLILCSDDDTADGEPATWLHTRGMRKFGRPDISVRGVPAHHQDAVVDLCNRFIGLQALGGIVPEGQEIALEHLPPGLVCRHAGDADDPDFNNVRIEISGPLAA